MACCQNCKRYVTITTCHDYLLLSDHDGGWVFYYWPIGGVLSAKTRSDKQLQGVRSYARDVVHALHKAQKKLSLQQVTIILTALFDWINIAVLN